MIHGEIEAGAAVEHGDGEKIGEFPKSAKSLLAAPYSVGNDHRPLCRRQPLDAPFESLFRSLKRERSGIPLQLRQRNIAAQFLFLDIDVVAEIDRSGRLRRGEPVTPDKRVGD